LFARFGRTASPVYKKPYRIRERELSDRIASAQNPKEKRNHESAAPLQMRALVEEARKFVEGDVSVDAHAKAALANIIRVGTSAGAARAKAVIAWNPKRKQIRSGQFDMAPGFEPWILTFDGVGKDFELGTGGDYGRTEYAYYKMAIEAGIVMSPCRLLEENGRAHFMTRRFDREVVRGRTIKHHLQTLCALNHLDYKQRGTLTRNSLWRLQSSV
jgi:serine/threonine-protein kinase HipA